MSLFMKQIISLFVASVRQRKDEILLKKISFKIKELRLARGLSQEQFYNETDIHIGRIETGRLNLTVSTLSKICQFLNISLSDFFEDI